MAVAAGVAVGIFQGLGTGAAVAAAILVVGGMVVVFRDPPPPNPGSGDPAGMNFGR